MFGVTSYLLSFSSWCGTRAIQCPLTVDVLLVVPRTWVMSKADGEAMLLLSPAAGLVANRGSRGER